MINRLRHAPKRMRLWYNRPVVRSFGETVPTTAAIILSVATFTTLCVLAIVNREAPKSQSTHVSIPSALFDIARVVCQNNGGYKKVTIEKSSDQFTFECNDGMTLKDAIVRIKQS